ncbi:MAG: hypothetical protein IT319_07265 [Anaerolineae bacterium]|nr:hypothetical protein [Anaerolineae bacterium]
MEFSFEWHDPDHTIVYMRYESTWELDVAQRAVDIYTQKVLEVPHEVDLIAHAVGKEAMNLPLWLLRVGANAILASPPNARMIVLVPNTTRILALADAGIRVLGERYRGRLYTAATPDEAYQLLLVLRKI